VTRCPECGSGDPNLESLGVQKGERLDPQHTFLISKFRCKACSAEFNEVMHCDWSYETTKHGSLERLLMMEIEGQPAPSAVGKTGFSGSSTHARANSQSLGP